MIFRDRTPKFWDRDRDLDPFFKGDWDRDLDLISWDRDRKRTEFYDPNPVTYKLEITPNFILIF